MLLSYSLVSEKFDVFLIGFIKDSLWIEAATGLLTLPKAQDQTAPQSDLY